MAQGAGAGETRSTGGHTCREDTSALLQGVGAPMAGVRVKFNLDTCRQAGRHASKGWDPEFWGAEAMSHAVADAWVPVGGPTVTMHTDGTRKAPIH
jgi:hypothetical protein